MKLKSVLKQKVLGLDIPNEYVCISENSFLEPLHVILKEKNEDVDITHCHVLLGYRPMLLGFHFSIGSDLARRVMSLEEVTLQFDFPTSPPAHPPTWVARLVLKKVSEIKLGEQALFVFEGLSGEHRFLSRFHQIMNRIYERLQSKKPGNIGLPGNLYDQVAIAYSMPRNISIVSLGDGNRFNLFPTDLHGAVGGQFYVGSLRHEGNASRQVEEFKKIVLSTVKTEAFRDVYALGKNHMGELKELERFNTFSELSEQWKLPLPESVISYRELQWLSSVDAGIHRIHCFRTVNQHMLRQPAWTLAHIHRYYAQWRLDHGLKTEWFIR